METVHLPQSQHSMNRKDAYPGSLPLHNEKNKSDMIHLQEMPFFQVTTKHNRYSGLRRVMRYLNGGGRRT